MNLIETLTEKQTDTIFKQMKQYRENYPNYIYALTMGLGKTILMGTCIFMISFWLISIQRIRDSVIMR